MSKLGSRLINAAREGRAIVCGEAPRFDAADYLDSPAAAADYLSEALATGDAEFIARAIDRVARHDRRK